MDLKRSTVSNFVSLSLLEVAATCFLYYHHTMCQRLMKETVFLTRILNCFYTIWILCYWFLQEYVSVTVVASYGISVNYCCCIRCCCLYWRVLWDRPAGRSGQHPSPSLQRWRPPRGGPAAPAHQPISISYLTPPTNQGKPRLYPAKMINFFTIFLEMTATCGPVVSVIQPISESHCKLCQPIRGSQLKNVHH